MLKIDYMKWATNITKQGVLKVPCIPVIEDGKNLLPNAQLKKICTGSGTLKDSYDNPIVWQETLGVHLEKAGTTIDWKYIEADLQLVIEIKATNGNIYSYHVGEHCISETMAYMIENTIYNNVIESPSDFPYRVVNYVCDYLMPGFSQDPLNIFITILESIELFRALINDFISNLFKYIVCSNIRAKRYF